VADWSLSPMAPAWGTGTDRWPASSSLTCWDGLAVRWNSAPRSGDGRLRPAEVKVAALSRVTVAGPGPDLSSSRRCRWRDATGADAWP